MSVSEPLTEIEKKSARIIFGISILAFLLCVPLWISGAIGLALLFTTIFIGALLYGHFKFDGKLTAGHAFEAFNIGSQDFHKKLAEIREEQEQRKLTDIKSIDNPELRQQVSDRMAEGWAIEKIENSSNRVILSSTKGGNFAGHAVTGVLTGLWTFGAGNVAYGKLSKKRNKERIVVRIDDKPSHSSKSKESKKLELLRELNNLKMQGAITQEEFEEMKSQLLESDLN